MGGVPQPHITEPFAMRVGWLERLLPQRHLIGATVQERARLTYTLGLALFGFIAAGFSFVWGLFDSNLADPLFLLNLASLLCFSVDGLLLYRFGCPRWLVYVVVLQLATMILTVIVVTGELAFSVWVLAPPMFLMLLISHRSGYFAAVRAVFGVMVLGVLKELGMLPGLELSGMATRVDPNVQAICLWLLSHLALMLVFDRRRHWAIGEARLITRVLLNVNEHATELLSRLHEQLSALLDAPQLSEAAKDALHDAEISAQRLSEAIEQLDLAAAETTVVRQLHRRGLEQMQEDTSVRASGSARLSRFQLQVSLALLLLCALLLPVTLLLRGTSYPLTWVLLSAVALLLPNLLLLRRPLPPRPTVLWLSVQMIVLCVLSTLLNGDLAHIVWLSHLPLLLLYAIGVRWALSSTAFLLALVVALSALLKAGFGLPPEPPLTGSVHIDQVLFSALFIITNILVLGYFERDRRRSASILTLRSSVLSDFSHELRTPLNGLLGTFSWLREELPPGDIVSAHLSLAERHGQQLLSVVDDALSLAVLSGGRTQRKLASFRLGDLVGRLQKESERLGELYGTNIIIRLVQPRPVQFSGEHVRLEKMLMSLLAWACTHRPSQAIRLRLKTSQSVRGRWHLQVTLFDIESPLIGELSDTPVSGLAELFGGDHMSGHRNALRVALCRAQLDFLAGRWDAAASLPRGLSLRWLLETVRS